MSSTEAWELGNGVDLEHVQIDGRGHLMASSQDWPSSVDCGPVAIIGGLQANGGFIRDGHLMLELKGQTLGDWSYADLGPAPPSLLWALLRSQVGALRLRAGMQVPKATPPPPEQVYFAVGDAGAHEGYVTSRRADDAWTPENEGGWTYQDVCDASATSAYCYSHNPGGL